MPRARYHDAVDWIARNENPYSMDQDAVATGIGVRLIAEVWEKPQSEVSRDVLSLRRRLKNETVRSRK